MWTPVSGLVPLQEMVADCVGLVDFTTATSCLLPLQMITLPSVALDPRARSLGSKPSKHASCKRCMVLSSSMNSNSSAFRRHDNEIKCQIRSLTHSNIVLTASSSDSLIYTNHCATLQPQHNTKHSFTCLSNPRAKPPKPSLCPCKSPNNQKSMKSHHPQIKQCPTTPSPDRNISKLS